MFNMENSAQKHKTTLLLCPAGEMDRGRGPSGSWCLACLVSRNLTFQLDLRGGIDTVLFLSVPLVLGALGRDHRVRNELLSPWCPALGETASAYVTASQSFPEGLGGASTVRPSPEVVLSC